MRTASLLIALLLAVQIVSFGVVGVAPEPAVFTDAAGGEGVTQPAETGNPITPLAVPETIEIATWKIDPSLRAEALRPSKEWSQVEITTFSMAELAPVLKKVGARVAPIDQMEDRAFGSLAFRTPSVDGIPVVQRIWVPNTALAEISSLPGVLSIGVPPRVEVDSVPRLDAGLIDGDLNDFVDSLRAQGIQPTNYPSIVEHGSLAVQTTFGVTGDGVNIALVDTTVDFNQPNLVGQWATVTDPGSPYFGWPILLDSSSNDANLGLWTAGSDFDRFPYPFFSSFGTFNLNFFSDTHYTIGVNATGYVRYQQGLGGYVKRQDPTGVSGTVKSGSILRDYYVGNATDPNRIVSASGDYRLGILKDDFLTALWGQRIGLLVVDWATPGVYDTVYADLDFDNDFTDENPANITSPLLFRDLDSDGLADLSGGIVYFIAQSTAVSGEVVIASAAGTETSAALANGNLAADFYGFFEMSLPTLSLDALYWPSAGETIWEGILPDTTGGGDETGTTAALTLGFNLMTFAAVDSATLLADYDLSFVYDIYNDTQSLVAGVDYTIDLSTGVITWLVDFPDGDFVDIIYQFDTWTVDFATGDITFLAPPIAGAAVTADYETGLPVPYADVMAARHGYDLFVPAGGDMVGVYGAFDRQSHGTATATTAAGANQGGMFFGILDTYGQAPGAKIISVDLFKPGATISEAWYFSVEGYDGVPGTTDDARIVSNSWGWVDLPEAGWEFYSRWKHDLTTNYAPEVVFVQSMGNDGPGYGTESSPTSPSSIQAGAGRSADMWWLLGLAGGEQYTQPVIGTGPLGPGPYGDVADGSSRGPNALGRPGVDVLGIGFGGIAGVPVNEFFDGAEAWDIFGGTSQAAPNIAGIVALMIEAYASTHGGAYPTPETLQSVIKTTADDVHQDVLAQGAGFANAWRAVNAMMELEGVTADVHEWVPGGYQGVQREMFVNLLAAGDADSQVITLTNHGTTAATVDFTDGVYERTGTFSFTWINPNTGAGSFYFGRPQWWMLNQTGVWRTDDTGFPGFAQEAAANLAPLWNTADFMKVFTYSDPSIGAHTPALFLRDWNDTNGNGVWDGPGSEDSLIAPTFFTSDLSFSRINAKVVHSPGTRVHDGLAVGHGALFGTSDGTPTPVTMYVEFYERVDWAWLSVSPASLNLGIGASGTVTATLTVPAGTAPGSYQGAIYYDDGTNTSTIPVLVNVPATELPLLFGGGTTAGTLYEPNAFNPGQPDMPAGDGRWFWFDTAALSAANRKLLYNLRWDNASSDAEIYAFHAVPDADWTDDAIYGPSTFELLQATKRSPSVTDTLITNWEFMGTDVLPGLFFVKIQALRTTEPAELMEGSIGVMTTTPDEARFSTNSLAGSVPISVTANVPLQNGLGTAVTELVTQVFTDQPVDAYAYPGGPFIDYLFAAPNKIVTVVPANTIVASWVLFFHSGADDVDAGIFYDSDCDGVYTVGDDAVGTVMATGNNPERASLQFPAPGCYWVHAAGFTVAPSGGLYDLTFEVNKIGISAFTAENEPTATVAANTPSGFDLSWDFPGSTSEGVITGFLFASPGFAPFALTQLISIFYSYDLTAPTFSAHLPAPGAVVNDATPGIFVQINDGSPGSIARRGEIDGDSVRAWLDGTDITSIASISVPHATNAGYPTGTVLFTPGQPLSDGPHTLLVQASDFAGNTASTTWTFTVDTAAPSLTITSPVSGLATSATSVTVSGLTEAGAAVTVAGTSVFVDGQGAFSASVSLSPGANAIEVSASDALGNTAATTVVVTQDSTAPAISLLRSSAGVLTNHALTVVSGVVDEPVSLTVAGMPTAVHADGSFDMPVALVEGPNAIAIVATDAAGNSGTASLSIVRDATPPVLSLDALPSETRDATVTVKGTVESGISFVTVNGQPVVVASGAFSQDVALSFGANLIFVEATDTAGNTAMASATVSYIPQGVTSASVGLILLPVMTVVALLVGLFFGQMARGRPRAGPPEAEELGGEAPAEERPIEELSSEEEEL